jgi:hypothetical protein
MQLFSHSFLRVTSVIVRSATNPKSVNNLRRMQEIGEGPPIAPSKCAFPQEELAFMGHQKVLG